MFDNWQESAPAPWAGDFRHPDHLIRGGAQVDAAQFSRPDDVVVTVSAAAVAGATSLTVNALSGPIPAGTALDFGTDEFARLSADAATGATTLSVDAIPTALEGGETATYAGKRKKHIPSGTVLGRTITERNASAGYGPAASTDDEVYILAFDVVDADDKPDAVLYRHNSIVKENFLPEVQDGTLASAVLDVVRANYRCIVGVN